jgi:hypothetical protein
VQRVFSLVLAMRKRKPQRQPSPTSTTPRDPLKVTASVLSIIASAVKLGEWVWSHWPFI